MIVVLTTSKGPVGVVPEAVRAVMPNKADTACSVIFSESHSIEVVGSLAKIRSKLNETGDAPAESKDTARPAAAVRPRPMGR